MGLVTSRLSGIEESGLSFAFSKYKPLPPSFQILHHSFFPAMASSHVNELWPITASELNNFFQIMQFHLLSEDIHQHFLACCCLDSALVKPHHGSVWSMLEISLSLIYQGPWSVLDLLDIFMAIGFNVKGCDLTGFPHFFYTHFQHENKHVNQFIVEFESCDLSVLVSTEITRLTLEENTRYFDITDNGEADSYAFIFKNLANVVKFA